MNILETHDVCKVYGDRKVLDDISVSVPEGTVYGLLGPNGAGKTTLIRIINHITAPDSGTVLFNGRQLTQDDVAHIGYLPEERGLYKKMKVGDQAVFFARLKGLSKQEATRQLHDWFDKFDIAAWWDRKVEELSKGMAQKVQFIVTVLHKPSLLIFDEPFSGFDPINANLLRDEIIKLKNDGATVIFSTHNMASVEEICDNITLINGGRNILTGNVQRLRREYADGRFKLVFDQSTDLRAVMEQLQPMANCFNTSTDKRDRNVLALKLTNGATLHDLIDKANSLGSLRGFEEVEASMNDIFINAVGAAQNNQMI